MAIMVHDETWLIRLCPVDVAAPPSATSADPRRSIARKKGPTWRHIHVRPPAMFVLLKKAQKT